MTKVNKGNVNLQVEVKNDNEWNEIINNEGLILVEIYSNWCGPCISMLSTLKKIKMELGGNLLHYVLACNDDITVLKRFHGKSEPVWMFIQNKKLVNLIFGSHCPNLKINLIKEIRRVENKELPNYELLIEQRTPDEEIKFKEEETIKKLNDSKLKSEKDKLEKIIYEEYLEHMMIELCEETALIILPWILHDENGHIRDKERSPPYLELKSRILPDRFDILEQNEIQLNENIIVNILNESGITINDDLIYIFTEGHCIAIRLKGRLPPPSWPVPYPYVSIEEGKKCPTRAINDVENFLKFILQESTTSILNEHDDNTDNFLNRYTLILEDSEDEEEDKDENEEIIKYPAVWFPINARNKVHIFKTLFSSYLNRAHPYVVPEKPLPFVAFKFDLTKLSLISELYQKYHDIIEYIAIFEFDNPRAKKIAYNPQDYLLKVKRQINQEIILIIIRRINENVFLTFAGNNPIAIEENEIKIFEIIHNYFVMDNDVESNSDIISHDYSVEAFENYYTNSESINDEIYY